MSIGSLSVPPVHNYHKSTSHFPIAKLVLQMSSNTDDAFRTDPSYDSIGGDN